MEVRRDMSSLILVIALFGYAFGNKVTSPSTNGVYQAGSQIVLPCSVDTLTGAVLSWIEYQTASTGNTICVITDKGPQCDNKLYPRYSIQANGNGTNSYNLVISNAVLADGGLYKCSFAQLGASPSMTVIVYDKLAINVPQQSNLNQPIPVSCSVTYQSATYLELPDNIKPVITLSAGNNKLTASTDASVTDKTKKTIALSLNGTTLITNYNQLPMNVSCSIAINSPAMVNTNYAPINVQYPTQKVTITIDPPSPDNKYTIGENSTVTVTCTADGYPTPTIVWSDQTTGTVPHLPSGDQGTSTIELDQDWAGSEHQLSCSATNNVGNSQPIYYNVTFTVGAAANVHVASANMGWIAAVVIVPIAVLVAIIVIVVVLKKKRNQAPKKTTAQPAQRPQDYNNQPYQPINQNPNFASPPPAAGYQPSPNNRHPMTRDSPGYGDLGVNRFAVPAGHPNLSASFDDNNSLNGRVPPQAPSSRAPDLPGNNRSPMMMQQPGMGMRQDPDTMV